MRLKSVDVHVLVSLLDHPRHGYGIVKEIRSRSGGSLRLEPGNLYRVLRRLLDVGLIEPSEPPEQGITDDDRRRYYVATPAGRATLRKEIARMRAVVELAETRLRPPVGRDA